MKSTSRACSTSASTKCPMRTLAITGIDAMRATPPSLRMSEGTRSSAITAQAPAFSAIFACSALVTSMMTPPFSISARPTFTRHSFEPLLLLPLPFTFFASISLLLSTLEFPGGCRSAKSVHRGAITTKRARPLARISPASLRISPAMNKFLPFCSVSRPSTTISCSTLTGFRYSTVKSAVTARASRKRQTLPMASSRSIAMIPPCANPPPPWYLSPKTNRPTILRLALSCSNVSFIPPGLSPPQPKHLFVGFGSSRMISLKAWPRWHFLVPYFFSSLFLYFSSSHQRDPAAFRPSHTALPLAHLDLQQFRQRSHPPRDLLFVQARKPKPQRVRQRALHVEVPSRRKQHAAFFRMNQQLARVEPQRKLQPQAHAAFRPHPVCAFRHILPQRLIQNRQPRSVDLAHFRQVLAEEPAPQELRERRLRKLIRMEVRRLLHDAQPLNGRRRRDDPPDPQSRECHLREAVNVDDDVRPVQLFQRRNSFLARIQPRVNMIFHDGNLVPSGQFQQLAP